MSPSMDIKEGCITVPDRMTAANEVRTGIISMMERTALILGSEERGPQKRIVCIVVPGTHSEHTIPGVGFCRPRVKIFTKDLSVRVNGHDRTLP